MLSTPPLAPIPPQQPLLQGAPAPRSADPTGCTCVGMVFFALLSIAMAVIAVSVVVLAVTAGTMEAMGVQEVLFLSHAMPHLVGHISASAGDGRLGYLQGASSGGGGDASPSPTAVDLERAGHMALVDETLAGLQVSVPANLDADAKLLMYAMAVTMVRSEGIIYNTARMLERTDVMMRLMEADMVDGARDTLFQMHNLTTTIADYLLDIRTGRASLPVSLSSSG